MNKEESKSALLAHYKSPTGLGDIDEHFSVAKGINPLCGDEISVGVILENDTIIDIKFQARACSICIASSSIMNQLLINKKTSQVEHYYQQLNSLLKQSCLMTQVEELLRPLASISAMPSRHKCAQLSWEALSEACKR